MINLIKSLKKLQDLATKKYIMPVLIMLAAVLIFMEKGSIGIDRLKELNGGIGMLDMQFGYTGFQVYNMLDNIGLGGRILYSKLLCIDFLFIFVYTAFHFLVIAGLIKKASLNDYFNIINVLPLLRSVLDVIENCFLLLILCNYPVMMLTLVNICSMVTIIKLILNYIIIAIIFILGALSTRQNLKSKILVKKESERI